MHKRTVQIINNINTIYRFYLTDDKIETLELVNQKVYKVNTEKIENILEKIEDIQKLISDNLNEKWSFERLDNLEKAILTVATFDIKYLNINKKIIINEIVNICKLLLINDNYKYINAVLDKI